MMLVQRNKSFFVIYASYERALLYIQLTSIDMLVASFQLTIVIMWKEPMGPFMCGTSMVASVNVISGI